MPWVLLVKNEHAQPLGTLWLQTMTGTETAWWRIQCPRKTQKPWIWMLEHHLVNTGAHLYSVLVSHSAEEKSNSPYTLILCWVSSLCWLLASCKYSREWDFPLNDSSGYWNVLKKFSLLALWKIFGKIVCTLMVVMERPLEENWWQTNTECRSQCMNPKMVLAEV